MCSNNSVRKTFSFTVAFGLTAALGFSIAPTTSVQAQNVGAPLEEIVVTARRREESLQDVPVAISVLNNDFISESNILDHYD
ncbi:MAG: hypothetical protein ACJ0S4_03515, partial [Candidatus Rariloculaceae bacterium]